jgi:hypothetical protein
MMRRATPRPGAVIWLAGHEVDRFDDFAEYFASMLEHNRLEVRELRGRADEILKRTAPVAPRHRTK